MDIQSNAGCLLQVKGLKKYFPLQRGLFSRAAGLVRAVDGVSFDIGRGETFGLVGESGCGKTTVGKTILRLQKTTEGEVLFEGKDVLKLSTGELRNLRRDMQIIFQDPHSSLNPRMSVGKILAEGFIIHKLYCGQSLKNRVNDLLNMVGLSFRDTRKYPHEFSSGQRQRIAIARALAVNPKFIVADEPVSALDVSIQAQLLNLLQDIQRELNVTYLFISHDLRVVKHISHRVAIMYLGRIVEVAETSTLFRLPLHPYTQALLSAVPRPDPGAQRERLLLGGEVPDAINPPGGCPFHPRCHFRRPECEDVVPELHDAGERHLVRCLQVS